MSSGAAAPRPEPRSPAGAASSSAVARWLAETSRWAEGLLEAWLAAQAEAPAVPAALVEALRHALLGGGKRLRPALVRLVCRELGGEDRLAAAPALAIELVHTYSLVHDDLPCMDDDDLRRGRPTCHVAFGEALAVLAGDALQAGAFEVLASDPALPPETARAMVRVLAAAAGPAGMVGGQVLDMQETGDPGAGGVPAAERVRAVHELKTARLLAAAAELGALAAGAGAEARAAAAEYGRVLGLAFQATDDVLDVTGDAATLGKTPGKDAALAKPSLARALGVEGARAEAEARGARSRELARGLGLAHGELALALVDHLLARRR